MMNGLPDPTSDPNSNPFFKGPRLPGFLKASKSGVPKGMAPGLETEPSKLGKVLDWLNRFNAAKNEALTGGNPLTGLKGQSHITGADVLAKWGLFNDKPTMTSENIGKGVGGFLFDALTDPLNLLTIGPVAKGAQELAQTGKLAKGAFNQMRQGQRALASVGIGKNVLETPEAINKAVGIGGGKIGEVLNALPGAQLVKDTFTPSFNVLRNSLSKVRQGSEDTLSKLFGNKSIPAYNKAYADGVGKIMKNPEKVLPKDVLEFYKAKGLDPLNKRDAGIIMGQEIYRHGDFPMIGNQSEKIFDLQNQINDPKFASSFLSKKSNTPAMLAELRVKAAEKLKAIKNTPTLASNIKAGMHFKEAETASSLIKSIDEKLPQIAGKAGLPFKEMEEGHVPRTASQASMKQLLGNQRGSGGSTLFPKLDQKMRTFGQGLTHGQAETLAASPTARNHFLAATFGGNALKHQKGLVEALTTGVGDSAKHEPFYESNPLVALQRNATKTAKASSSVGEMKSVVTNPAFASAKQTPEMNRLVKIPEQFQQAIGKKQVYMADDVAKEFGKWSEIITNPKALNQWLNVYDNFISSFKRWTLFGTPIVGLQTASKYIMGHSFIAYMHNAFSSFGAQYAAKAAGIALKRSKLMEKGEEGAQAYAKLVEDAPKIPLDQMKLRPGDQAKYASYITPQGFNLYKLADDLGRFSEGATRDIAKNPAEVQLPEIASKISKYTGTEISKDLGKAADSFSRLQYAATRVKQGFDPITALDEARTNLYDYAGGLSDFETNVFRRLIPFWSWIRFNTPSMLLQTLQHPGKAANVQKAISNIEATTGKPEDGHVPNERILDDFLNGQLHVRLYEGADGKWRYFGLQHYLPLADLESFTSPGNAFHELTGALSPIIKTPIETATNKSLVFKKPGGEAADISRYPGEQTSVLGLPVNKMVANALEENFRPLAELNRLNPGNIFGKQGDTNKLGATRDIADESPIEKLLKMVSLRTSPFDQERAIANSQAAYRNRVGQYKSALNRAKRMGHTSEAGRIQDLIDLTNKKSILLPSHPKTKMALPHFHKRGGIFGSLPK